MDRLPAWLRAIGALETVCAMWGFYAMIGLLASNAQLNVSARLGVATAFAIAIGTAIAGLSLASGRSRALRPMMWLLIAQTVRIVVPGVVWLVSLGWAAKS